MKGRQAILSLALVVTLFLTSPTFPVFADSVATLSLDGAPVYTTIASNPAICITYTNNNPSQLTVIVIGVVHNQANQTVAYVTATAVAAAGARFTVCLVLAGLAPGVYCVDIFAVTTTGIAISTTATICMTVPGSGAGNVLNTQTFTLSVPLEFCSGLCGTPFIKATYRNNLNTTTTGIVFAVVHNPIGQTVYYTSATISPAPGKDVSAYLVVAGLPSGTYDASVFVVHGDVVQPFVVNVVPISTTSTINFSL